MECFNRNDNTQVHLALGGLVLLWAIIVLNGCFPRDSSEVKSLSEPIVRYELQIPGPIIPTNTYFSVYNDVLAITANGRRFSYQLKEGGELTPYDTSLDHSIYQRPTGVKLLGSDILVFDDHMPPRVALEYTDSDTFDMWDGMFRYDDKDYYVTMGWDIVPQLRQDTLTTFAYLDKANYFQQYKSSAAFKLLLDTNGTLKPIEKLFGFHASYTKDNFTRSVRPILNFVEGQMVYAFNSIDSLFVQQPNGTTKALHVDIDGWKVPDLFPIERLSDNLYVEKYLSEQPQLKMLVYNTVVQKLYLVVKLPNTYEKEDGSLELFQDGPWAIIRFNNEFEQEVQYSFPGKQYHNELVLPYKNGLLLARADQASNSGRVIKLEYHEGI